MRGIETVFKEISASGMGSFLAVLKNFGKVKENTVPEGESFYGLCTGKAQTLIDTLLAGVRSGLTYGGSKDIKEFQRKVEIVKVTPNYMQESSFRK